MKVLVLGAGKMGYAVVYDLLRNKDVNQITVADAMPMHLDKLEQGLRDARIKKVQADISDHTLTGELMRGHDVVISCVTYKFNFELAKAAVNAGAHFCDLGGNEDIVRKEFTLDQAARESNVAVIPDCGLAPGMVSLLAAAACAKLKTVSDIHLRVGGLPADPQPPLNYCLCFSVEGLINEYVEPVTVIKNGRLETVPSLDDLEELTFPAPFSCMEAFNTSGGISTLPHTYAGKVRTLDYKTIRYPGHCAIVKSLKDLGFMDAKAVAVGDQTVPPRAVLAQALETHLPKNQPDVVLIRVSAKGTTERGEAAEFGWELIDYMDEASGLSAMMRNTAFPVSIIAQMLGSGEMKDRGVLYQERSVPTARFIDEMKRRGVMLKETQQISMTASPVK